MNFDVKCAIVIHKPRNSRETSFFCIDKHQGRDTV